MSDLRQRLQNLLQTTNNSAVLRFELTALMRDNSNEFYMLAEMWFPALYERDKDYFSNFLSHNFTRAIQDKHVSTAFIEKLLPQLETNGSAALFQNLYRFV